MSRGRVCVIRPGPGKDPELPLIPHQAGGKQQPPGLSFLGQQPLLTLSLAFPLVPKVCLPGAWQWSCPSRAARSSK